MSRIPLIQLPAPRAERPNDPLEEKTFKEEVLFNSSFVKMVRDAVSYTHLTLPTNSRV